MDLYLILASLLLLVIILGYTRSKQARKKVIRVIDNNCSGCQRCIKKCRHNVFNMANDEKRLHIAVKYPKNCTACGDCVAVCKFNALELANRK